MIGKAMKGKRSAGLVRYLYSDGKANEHMNPRIVAGWDEDLASLEPVVGATGQRDFRQLTALLDQPLAVAGVDKNTDGVYHLVLRAAPEDPILTDEQWRQVAEDAMDRTGIAPRGDDEACRWVAVRHADDHVHIVATLARQDGRRVWPRNDFHRIRETCHAAEARFGLRSTAPGDRTATTRPTRAESEKAVRTGQREPARATLRRQVRVAAAGADSIEEFFFRLRADGVLVKARESERNPGQITGYSVAKPGATDKDGNPVFYGGGKLAADLTLPKLLRRWDVDFPSSKDQAGSWREAAPQVPGPRRDQDSDSRNAASGGAGGARAMGAEDRRRLFEQAAAAAGRASQHIAGAVDSGDPHAAADAAWAASDYLSSAARLIEGRRGGPLTEAADAFDRAARESWGRTPAPSQAGSGLRSASRLLALAGAVTRSDTKQLLHLMTQLCTLADTVTRLREAQQRAAEASAARQAADQLRVETMRRHVAAGVNGTGDATRGPRQGTATGATQAPAPGATRRPAPVLRPAPGPGQQPPPGSGRPGPRGPRL